MRIKHITVAIVLLAGLGISCRDKENDIETIAVETESEIQTDTSSANVSDGENSFGSAEITRDTDAAPSSDKTTQYTGNGSTGRTSSSAVNRSQEVQRSTAKKTTTGYSAPDGTAAENHDGDMYTKHDTTRMPSGPPIK